MKDYSEFPPCESFKKVLKSNPQSALLYVSLWKLKFDKSNSSIKKSDINGKFLISKTLFRNHLLALSRLELMSFKETDSSFVMDVYDNSKK